MIVGVKTSTEVPSSEVLIFRPSKKKKKLFIQNKNLFTVFLVIRFVESDTNGKQSENPTSPKRTDRCLLILFGEKIGMLQLEDTLRVQRKEEYLK